MATGKPRFSITVSDDVYQQINEYQHEHRLSTQTKAVLAFIEKGLEVIQKEKKPPTGIIAVEQIQSCQKEDELSPIERTHIQKYRLLDPYGKEAVDGVLDIELRRIEQDEGVIQFDPKTQIVKIAGKAGRREDRQLTESQVKALMERIYALDDPDPTV